MNKYMEHVNSIRDSVQKQWPTDLSNGEERNGMGKTHLQQLIELDELREQLAAAQATISRKDEALREMADDVAATGQDDLDCNAVEARLREIAALPADRTALDAMLAPLQERLECESKDADRLLNILGLDPERYRTDGGFINMGKVRAAVSHPSEYPIDERGLIAMLADARKEGMLNAAVIAEDCDQEYEPYVGTPRPLNYTCADAIRQAAERIDK